MKTHAGMKGLRLFVYKPGGRTGYTTVYASAKLLTELLPLVDNDVKALAAVARMASLRARKSEGMSWGSCVIRTMRRLLEKEHEAALAAAAAENNAAWAAA